MRISGKPGMITAVLSVLTAVGSRTFMGACIHDDGSFGACHWAAQAILGVALLIAAESVTAIFVKNAGMRKGLYLSTAMTAVLGILIPGTLIGLCGMPAMRCRAVMRPAATILFALTAAVSACGFILMKKE